MGKTRTDADPSDGCTDLLTTGDMARLSDSTLRTVRFYQQEGLIEPERRNHCGNRLFDQHELTKLQLALDLREAGLSLHDIKCLFALKAKASCPENASNEMAATLKAQIDNMEEKITKLRSLRDELCAMVSVIQSCQQCEDPKFPIGCGKCDVVADPKLPRALRILWQD